MCMYLLGAEIEIPHFIQKPPIFLPGIIRGKMDADGRDDKEGDGGEGAIQKEKEIGTES